MKVLYVAFHDPSKIDMGNSMDYSHSPAKYEILSRTTRERDERELNWNSIVDWFADIFRQVSENQAVHSS